MKRFLLLPLLLLTLFVLKFEANAQNVGISDAAITPDASAVLEVRSTDKGLLIPRVALTQTTVAAPVTTPATSLLVFNTASVNDVTPGFYYWSSGQWVRILAGSLPASGWELIGNSGTNPSTNFLGTIDAQDFVIRTSNNERIRVQSGGNVGINTTPTARLHVDGTVRFVNLAAQAGETTALVVDATGNVKARVLNAVAFNGYTETDPLSWRLAGNAIAAGDFIGTTNAQDFIIRTNNTEKVRIQSGGNVGINTTPTARLHVDGTVRFVNLAAQAGETTALVVDATGNVKARTLNTVAFNGYTETDPLSWRLLGNAGTNPGTNYLGTSDAQALVFRTSAVERMRILSTGNVGIGTTTPSTQFHTTGGVRFENYASGANGAVLRTDANGNLLITNFTGSATDVLLGNGTFGPAPGAGLWQDQTTYIRPLTTTGATYPWIYDDNTTVISSGNTSQFFMNTSGANTQAGLFVYSSQNLDGTGWGYDQTRANIKAYDFWGNNYNAAIAAHTYMDYAGSSAILATHAFGGLPRAELATKSTTYDGSASVANYALKLTGDFYNQEIVYGQSTLVYFTGTYLLRTINITTHGTGINNSIVWIHGECDFYKTGTNSFVCFYIYRDGTLLCEISEISYINEDKTVHVQWMDEPPAGDHTYELRAHYPSGGITYYGHQLHVVELKR